MALQEFMSTPEFVAPGETGQLVLKMTQAGVVRGAVVGPNAKMLRYYVGREKVEIADDAPVNLPVKANGLCMLVVENTGDEPMMFVAAFSVEVDEPAPAPQPPPPVAAPPPAAPTRPELSQALPPEPSKTAAELGVYAGANEVAVCMMRNEAFFLLEHLRQGHTLDLTVKHGVIRRLDSALRPAKKRR